MHTNTHTPTHIRNANKYKLSYKMKSDKNRVKKKSITTPLSFVSRDSVYIES